jgi:hypothetical protein
MTTLDARPDVWHVLNIACATSSINRKMPCGQKFSQTVSERRWPGSVASAFYSDGKNEESWHSEGGDA